ncbi:MAG: hypothetical protein GX088_02690 [Clostridia bacterium]|nr:hypothetical protein [Clostridia bacterium]
MCEKNRDSLGNFFLTEKDEYNEKHAPVIYCPEKVSPGKLFEIKITIGEKVPHPNTWEHHIKWIQVFVKEENAEPVHVMTYDMGPTIAEPHVTFSLRLQRSVKVYVIAYCNIHGLWEATSSITVG